MYTCALYGREKRDSPLLALLLLHYMYLSGKCSGMGANTEYTYTTEYGARRNDSILLLSPVPLLHISARETIKPIIAVLPSARGRLIA
jgi:hypothetical protein